MHELTTLEDLMQQVGELWKQETLEDLEDTLINICDGNAGGRSNQKIRFRRSL